MKCTVRFDTRFDLQGHPNQISVYTMEGEPLSTFIPVCESTKPIELDEFCNQLVNVATSLRGAMRRAEGRYTPLALDVGLPHEDPVV